MVFIAEKVSEAVKDLFSQRLLDVKEYWENMSDDERYFLMGTSFLMDGNVQIGKEFYAKIPENFQTLYNLFLAHQQLDKENPYEDELKKRYFEEFKERQNDIIHRRVAYFFPHLKVRGATKMMVRQVELLKNEGYEVDIYLPYTETNECLHVTLYQKEYEIIPYKDQQELEEIAKSHDIAIAPYWDHVFHLWKYFRKVYHYSQGEYETFSSEEDVIRVLRGYYWLPQHIFTVSRFMQQTTSQKFQRTPSVHPCAIDLNLFHPGQKFETPTVLLVGRAHPSQKQIMETLDALIELREKETFDIIWVTPDEDNYEHPFVKTIHDPTQEELASFYRKSHIFITASLIEGFSLPPLEAMASGTAVLSTDSGGNREYALHDQNILLFNSWDKMKQYTSILLHNEKKREKLIHEGLKTVQQFQVEALSKNFMDYFNQCNQLSYFTKYEKAV